MRTSAIVVAAGEARRMGSGENKIFLPIGGVPLLTWTMRSLSAGGLFDEYVLVVRAGEEARVRSLLPAGMRTCTFVEGGRRRCDSALAGVRAARGRLVLIHDAARPFPSQAVIRRVIDGAEEHGACVPVVPVVDTLRYGASGDSLDSATVARANLFAMQTPQGFERTLILQSLTDCPKELVDDAEAVLARGGSVHRVEGEFLNFKVTSPADVASAERVAQSRVV